jgi:GMP synthase-like glutamine amidotransferase
MRSQSRAPTNAVVFQHAVVEHPGVFTDFFREDGVALTTVELDEGEPIPDLAPFDLMVVMGGPQDVWQEDQYEWLRSEKEAIKHFVLDMGRPYLGICLGHQLLADALGGRVGLAEPAEIGVLTVSKSAAGKADPAMAGIPDPLPVLQWHSAAVLELPPAATILAESEACPVQAFRYGDHAYGMQFHVEVIAQTVKDWAEIPEYAQALEKALGADAVVHLDERVASALPEFNRSARILYDGLKEAWARV